MQHSVNSFSMWWVKVRALVRLNTTSIVQRDFLCAVICGCACDWWPESRKYISPYLIEPWNNVYMHARQPMLHTSSIPKRSEDAVACSIIRLHPLKSLHFVSSSQNCGKPDPEPIIVFSSRRCRWRWIGSTTNLSTSLMPQRLLVLPLTLFNLISQIPLPSFQTRSYVYFIRLPWSFRSRIFPK